MNKNCKLWGQNRQKMAILQQFYKTRHMPHYKRKVAIFYLKDIVKKWLKSALTQNFYFKISFCDTQIFPILSETRKIFVNFTNNI